VKLVVLDAAVEGDEALRASPDVEKVRRSPPLICGQRLA
jgi:hypothetical protein